MNLTFSLIYIYKKWQLLMSQIMKLFLRLNGAKIGKNTYISISSKIVGKKIHIGKDCKILENTKIKASEITIGDSVIVSSGCFFSGRSKLSIGDKTYIGKKARIDLSSDVKIGYDVGFGENSIIWTHGYFPPADEGYPVTYSSVSIEDSAWVSTGIIILPGVIVGKKSIISAGSVVTKSVPEGVIVEGNPAKIITEVRHILNKKEYLIILEELIDKYRVKEILNKQKYKNAIIYEFKTFEIHIIESSLNGLPVYKSRKKQIVLFKNFEPSDIPLLKKHFWFDFDKKVRIRTRNREVINLSEFFQGFGIRFLVDN